MTRGILQVYLGAAPGVGKTFSMLEEGRRLREKGLDVVVGLVETHGRAETARLAEGLELIPRLRVAHRGVELGELDLGALIARRPDWALVDELAHTNAPGSRNDKRWQDVQELLEAGINVISTVNIQHIDSLNDVVQSITGVTQRETIPDSVLRSADQIEVVDLAPEALRTRLSGGQIYPAGTIDAALSNYFRLGNLTALRELALLWLADEVDVALQEYRNEHGIRGKWEARERVVVALPGGAEGETLIRRGARIAARSSGGQLLAVHVASSDGLAESNPAALLSQRTLVESLGGSYHQVVGDSTPTALVEFARGVNATQLVIGVSRRSRLTAFLTGQGIGATVIRASGDIDVHIVSHASAGTLQLPRSRGALTVRRRLGGFVLAVLGLPLLTLLLSSFRSAESLVSEVLAFQLLIVVVALVGGIWPAVTAAVFAGLALDYFFVEPLYRVTIANPLHLLALLIFLIIAVLVSLVVDQAASRSRAAKRSAAEAETLATVAGSIIRGENAVEALANRLREVFGMTSVTVNYKDTQLYEAGAVTSGDNDKQTVVPLSDQGSVVLRGRDLQASDRRILDAFLSQIEAALVQNELRTAAQGIRPLEEADRLRTALLAAVGHDLRTPLSSATAAVSSLRSTDVDWSDRDREELLATAEESLHRLADLVNDLLDASRLQAGVLPISLATVGLDEIVPLALDELKVPLGRVRVDVAPDLPAATCDPVLVQRVLVNLIANALRYSPEDAPLIITASSFGERVELRVIDRGPGIPKERLAEAFQPFQRLGDTDNTTGVGLGLALANGFMEAMGGSLEAEDTPGGGLTMVISLPTGKGHR
ncbi:ATP-binding protein [Lacisediminihabitans profunda]|uniref:histidine kinase n=1 Tax=Lacisediminihabitans profunda TaxID=2594790 RepID=A0A5C8UX49_9MICO|nr:ATP-binding protein [Lacisediminihabitans profunda]TXN32177.1 sensor histidine kinase KdpD [Lacisediminihabitans profunda]